MLLKVAALRSTIPGIQSESSLINRALGGDARAFYALVQQSENAIFMAAWAVLKNDAEAEDAATEAVLKAFADLHNFSADSKFSAWLVQLTIEQARLKLGKAGQHTNSLAEQQSHTSAKDMSSWTEIPTDALHSPSFRTALTEAIAQLDAQARTVFVLRDIEKFSIQETARILAMSEGEVRAMLARARLQIANELAPGMKADWASVEPRGSRAQSC